MDALVVKWLLCVGLASALFVSSYSLGRSYGVFPPLTHFLNPQTGLYDRRAWMKWRVTPKWLKGAAMDLQRGKNPDW